MKKARLYRPKEAFNKHCSYEIVVDKNHLIELKNNEEKLVQIPDGLENAQLEAKIQWCGSDKMDLRQISDNERIKVSGNEFLNRKLPLFDALFPITGILVFNNSGVLAKNIGIGILVLLLLGLIDTLTIGRKKWLKIKAV